MNLMKLENRLIGWSKKLGIFGIAACGVCCLSPLLFALLGISAISWMLSAFEWIGIVSLVIAGILLTIGFLKRKTSSSCSVDCSCKKEEGQEGLL
ncbi:hypothetical protein [Leptospira borgpetersenii]|uniref:hypothetical protein n=1 Tax=Leptospira borgpetersenii TaxID=174 RepID=UPI000772E459|nr:hypothetical protein [Leptospira borgpetersenii]